MSDRPSPSREELEAALRVAFERVLPSLVDAVIDGLAAVSDQGHPRPSDGRGPPVDLSALFSAAHAGGETAVRAVLATEQDPVAILRTLDRFAGRQAARWKDPIRVREAIVAEIMRRATRNDSFLTHGLKVPSTRDPSP